MDRKIKTLKGVAIVDVLKIFNKSFSDYFIPFKLTQEQLISKMNADKTDLSLSVGVFEDENLIAFILHGFDTIKGEKVVYNGGTGVIPEKRGSRLTKQMYEFILPILEKKGINRLMLEVIDNNIQAIKSYKKSGFKIDRELLCYKGKIHVSNKNNDVIIKDIIYYDWNLMESFWDVKPTWQNSNSTLDKLKESNISLGAYLDNKLVGYVIFNPINNRIHQIAVGENFRQKGVASALIFKLMEAYGKKFSIINVDKSSKGINMFLKKLGFEMYLKQFEMRLELDRLTYSNNYEF